MNDPFSVEIQDSDNQILVTMSGDLIINHINSITELIKTGVDFTKSVKLLVNNVTNIDITSVQLFLAIQKACEEKSLSFELESSLADNQTEILTKSGLADLLN